MPDQGLHQARTARQDTAPRVGSILPDLQQERSELVFRLLKRSERANRELTTRSGMVLLVDAILLSSLGWLLAGSPRLVGVGNLAIRLIFSLGAVFSAVLLAISIAQALRSLFFLHKGAGSPFFNLNERVLSFPNAETLRREFNRTARSKFLEYELNQLQTEAEKRKRQGGLLRWAVLFLMVALLPYLVAIVFEVFLLFL